MFSDTPILTSYSKLACTQNALGVNNSDSALLILSFMQWTKHYNS